MARMVNVVVAAWVPLVLAAGAGATSLDAGPVHVRVTTTSSDPVGVEVQGLDTPAPGDDSIVLYQDVREVAVRVDAPVPAQEVRLNFQEPVLEHRVFETANGAFEAYRSKAPGAARERFDAGFQREGIHLFWNLHPHPATHDLPSLRSNNTGGPLPYPNEAEDTPLAGTSVDYDRIYLRPSLANGTDVVQDQARTWFELCWLGEYWRAAFGQRHCLAHDAPMPWAALKASLPSAAVSFHLRRVDATVGEPERGPSDGGARSAAVVEASAVPVGGPTSPSKDERLSGQPDAPLPGAERAAPDALPWGREPLAPLDASATALEPGRLPLALAAALGLLVPLAWLLYHRLRKSEVLGHGKRAAILDAIGQRPGISEQELAQALGVGHTLVDYHTRRLANHGLLRIRRIAGTKCFYPMAEETPGDLLRPLLRRGRTAAVLGYLAEHPGATLSQVAAGTGMTPSSAHWHVRRLQAMGIVVAERAGREVRLDLTAARRAAVLVAVQQPPLASAGPNAQGSLDGAA